MSGCSYLKISKMCILTSMERSVEFHSKAKNEQVGKASLLKNPLLIITIVQSSSILKLIPSSSQQSMDDLKCQNELLRQPKVTGGDIGADGSAENAEGRKLSDHLEKPKLASKVAKAIQKTGQTALTTVSMSKDSVKMPSTLIRTGSSSLKPPEQ